jgi:hypothetical protein
MQEAKVTRGRTSPLPDPEEWAVQIKGDWDEADCLCQGKVPADKQVVYERRILRERDEKWVWKPFMRLHIDCPIHGPNRNPED